jgi:hypothetical protein
LTLIGTRIPRGLPPPIARGSPPAMPNGGFLIRLRGEVVCHSLGVGAAVALELRLDPVVRGAIAIRALPAVAELRQPLDGRLVTLEIEA